MRKGPNTEALNPMWVKFCEEVFKGHVGNEFAFYGAAERQFKLDDTVWEAIEDPDDGYRSHLDTMLVKPESQTIFFQTPVARVKLVQQKDITYIEDGWSRKVNFWQLIDVVDGHVWLTFGTDNTDDYYPCFTFKYEPKP